MTVSSYTAPHLGHRTITPAQFTGGMLTYSQFLQRIKEPESLLDDPQLVVSQDGDVGDGDVMFVCR